MRILFLAQRVPYPPNRGDKITTWRLLERMRRVHDVQVVAFAHDQADIRAAAALREMGISIQTVSHSARAAKIGSLPLLLTNTPMTLGVFGSKKLQAIVDELASDCDLGYAYSSSMGAFLLPHPQLARIQHFAELDSDKWKQYAGRTAWPMSWVYRREWRTLLEFERKLAQATEQNVFCTPLEENIFKAQIPGAPSTVLRNGVDLEAFKPDPSAAEDGHLVFTGVMDYYPNVDGVTFFVEQVLPEVRKRFPAAHFSIVGSSPTPEVQRLGQMDGVTVTGFVDDTVDWLRRARISVAPLRIARGIQNKVLEAMAMGLPVVGTTCATQGTEGTPGKHFLLAESAKEQVEAICNLLENPTLATQLGNAGRRYVEDHYDWEVTLAPLDDFLESALVEHHAARK